MRQLYIKRTICCILSVITLSALLFVSSPILEHKDSAIKYHDFYEYDSDFDALFIGSSHVLNGINPMTIWHQNGIPSYNLGFSGFRMGTAYWVLRNALEYSNPPLIVLDCAYLEDTKSHSASGHNHRTLDRMNHYPTKIKAVFDLFDTTEDRLRYLFPFSVYHYRWADLEWQDFHPIAVNGSMGFSGEDGTIEVNLPDLSNVQPEPIDNISTDYLRKIITECQNRNIQILLTYIPFEMNDTSQNEAVFIQTLADEYDVLYLSADDLMQILDPATDFCDNMENNSHLNFSGSQKLSAYIGDFISEHYHLQDRRNDKSFAHWHKLYDMHLQSK